MLGAIVAACLARGGDPYSGPLPEWRNGRRSGLKIHRPNRLVGSTPTSRTKVNPKSVAEIAKLQFWS